MARSTAKVILFTRVTHDKKVHQWPTAVFNDHDSARAYATMIKMAHSAGNTESARALDAKTAVDGDGKLIPGIKFSIAEVPYAPQPVFSEEGLFDEDTPPTS